MTKEEIIGILQECGCESCLETIKFINRQQAENERLKASRDKWKEIATIFDQAIRDKDATIEMLEEMVGEE